MAVGAAALVGAGLITILLLRLGEHEDLQFNVLQTGAWTVLFPSSLILAWMTGGRRLLISKAMLAGVFLGTCATMLIALSGRANLFPVAAALFSLMVLPAVGAGGALGWLACRLRKRDKT